MTRRLYLDDVTMRASMATVREAEPGGILLDVTPFYPRAGGQPGDAGTLTWSGGTTVIIEARKGEGDAVLHLPREGDPLPPPGSEVTATLDWPRRHAHMRMHTAMHLLCSLLPGAAVTGGSVGAEKSRLDFDLSSIPDKDALEKGLDALIADDHPVTTEWVDENVLDSNPGLVRTLSVQPPRGTGRLRLVRIGAGETPVDLQPCGGTHVGGTGEIGRVRILKIENKGRQNRRISIGLED